MPRVVCKVWSERPPREAGKWSPALEGTPPHRRWREVSRRLSQPPAFRRQERRRGGMEPWSFWSCNMARGEIVTCWSSPGLICVLQRYHSVIIIFAFSQPRFRDDKELV